MSMRANLIAPRAILALLCALALLLVLAPSWAGVPNKDAKPAYAEEQTMLQIE
ncbi:MAG: Formate dehydrogenase, partial [Massilia sp.]|nr:Formate dehydrogenase [Massilia sp.]